MHQFLKFVLGMKIYAIRTVPLSIIRSFSLHTYTQQWYMSYSFADNLQVGSVSCLTYTIAVITVKKLLMVDGGTVRNM
jgi:hypothetical protein